MGFSGNLAANPIVNLVGAAIPAAYTTTGATRFQAGAARKISLWLKIVINGASSVTAIKVKFSARYDASVAASEVDIGTTDATSGAASSATAEQSYTVVAGNTYYKRVDCTIGDNVPGDFVIQVLATGATNAGDSVVGNVVAW